MRRLTYLLIMFISFSCSSKMENLEQDYRLYIKALNKADYETATTLVSQKLFENTSRDQVIEQLGLIRKNYGELIIDSLNFIKCYDFIEQNDTLYTKVDYSSIIKIGLLESKKERAEKFYTGFCNLYSSENVFYDSIDYNFKIYTTGTFYCLSSTNGNDWTFLEDMHVSIYQNIIPEEVLNKLDN